VNIRELDLNLLVALDRLLELKSVSAAAIELGVTQPAMSNILARLRRTFDDSIMVKAGRKLEPTVKARELAPALKEILNDIQVRVLDSKGFDPATDAFNFRLAFHDYEQLVIHSRLLPNLLNYPRISIEHVPSRSIHPTDDLGSGAADFATGPVVRDRAGIVRSKLFSDDFVCLADRRNRQLKSRGLSLENFVKLDHIFIAPHGGMTGQVDEVLAKKKLARKVRLSVTEFSTLPWFLLGTDLIVTIPRRAAQVFSSHHKDLVIYECPVKVPPLEIFLTWHERLRGSRPHQWLKELILKTLAGS
jgi:DNA-binding transcriptional LysR family regulator